MNYSSSTDLITQFQNIWIKHGDPRTSNWFLTRNLYPAISIILIYLLTVLFILPQIFKHEKHQKFQTLLGFYYFIHSGISFAYVCIMIILWPFPNFRCDPVNFSYEGFPYITTVLTYYWVWFKFSEMIETFLVIIVYGSAPIFNIIHHTLHPFLVTFFVHFFTGGSPLFFGFINNLEHALLYFVIALRTVSIGYKKKTNSWFKKFHLIVSIGALWVSIFFYIQLTHRDDCNYELVKIPIIFAHLIFVFLSIYFRWSYISHPDAFGRTSIVTWINGKARLCKNSDGM